MNKNIFFALIGVMWLGVLPSVDASTQDTNPKKGFKYSSWATEDKKAAHDKRKDEFAIAKELKENGPRERDLEHTAALKKFRAAEKQKLSHPTSLTAKRDFESARDRLCDIEERRKMTAGSPTCIGRKSWLFNRKKRF